MADADLRRGPTVAYVNEIVLTELRDRGISMTADCRITNDLGLSASQFVNAFMDAGWSWPMGWHRRNRNYLSHDADARHFEKEVEPGRWIHVVVSPGLREEPPERTWLNKIKGRPKVSDWNLPPRHVELHAERGWSRPSSFRHLRQFVVDRLWPFQVSRAKPGSGR